MNKPDKTVREWSVRFRTGIVLVVLGLLIFLLGASPSLYGIRNDEFIGTAQIIIFILGLGLITLGGYLLLIQVWLKRQKTIAADFGVRLVSSGYVIAMVSGLADLFGLGTRPLPNIPFFGIWQARGVVLGEIVIIIGFFLMIPFRGIINKTDQ